MTGLVHRANVLRVHGFGNARWQVQFLGQLYARHGLKAVQDHILPHSALGNQRVEQALHRLGAATHPVQRRVAIAILAVDISAVGD